MNEQREEIETGATAIALNGLSVHLAAPESGGLTVNRTRSKLDRDNTRWPRSTEHAAMICDHWDCSLRTTDRCGACDRPFCAQHLHQDGSGRYCAACRTARWRKGLEREALVALATPFVGPFMMLRFVDPVTKPVLELSVVASLMIAIAYGAILVRRFLQGPPVDDTGRPPRN